MPIPLGVTKNQWVKKNGIFSPVAHNNFSRQGLQLYAPLWHPEQQGYALSYDGNDSLSNAIANFRSGDSQGTIEVWFRSSSAANQALFATSDTTSGDHYIELRILANKIRFTSNENGTNADNDGAIVVTNGKWHHLILSSNGTAYTLIIDGVQDVLTGTNNGDWFADITARDNLTIGVFTFLASTDYLIGQHTTVRIYSRPVLQPEAQTNFQRGRFASASDPTGLVFNLPCTEGTGNPVDTVDSLTMTATGATWIESLMDKSPNALPMSAFGIPTWGNTGRDFNGTSHKINVNGTVTGIKAFILWIYPDDNTSRSIMDFDAGTHSIEMDGSGDLTATGWNTPKFYVNAVEDAIAVTQSAWNLIMVSSATAFNGTAIVFGQETSYYDGKIGEGWGYNRQPSQAEITQIINSTKWRYS